MGALRLAHARSAHAKLKPLLMDQKFLAGIGNIYSDEILWGAGLRWDRMSDSLTSQEVRRLYRAMIETLQDAVKHRGSSLADEQYVDLFGKPGEFQHHHNVYAARGKSCPRCRHDDRARARSAAGPPSSARRARSDLRGARLGRRGARNARVVSASRVAQQAGAAWRAASGATCPSRTGQIRARAHVRGDAASRVECRRGMRRRWSAGAGPAGAGHVALAVPVRATLPALVVTAGAAKLAPPACARIRSARTPIAAGVSLERSVVQAANALAGIGWPLRPWQPGFDQGRVDLVSGPSSWCALDRDAPPWEAEDPVGPVRSTSR